MISVDELPGSENAGKMDPEHLSELLAHVRPVVHESQPAAVSITQPTEYGTVYSIAEVRKIASIAKEYGMLVHMDGARFGNALENLGCTPAEMTWKSGVDVLSFGATKNGAMCAESLVFFEDSVDDSRGEAAAQTAGEYGTGGPVDLRLQAPWSTTPEQAAGRAAIHRKRTGHLFSKMRFISAQLVGYLEGDVWRAYARNANEQAAALADGLSALPDFALLYPSTIAILSRFGLCACERSFSKSMIAVAAEINMLHIEMPLGVMEALQAEGFGIQPRRMRPGDDESGLRYCRLVTSWSTGDDDVAHLIARAQVLRTPTHHSCVPSLAFPSSASQLRSSSVGELGCRSRASQRERAAVRAIFL